MTSERKPGDPTVLDRFMAEIAAGADVWYVLDESKTAADGFVIYEPTPQGKPWTWVSGQEIVDKLLKRAPQAMRVLYIFRAGEVTE